MTIIVCSQIGKAKKFPLGFNQFSALSRIIPEVNFDKCNLGSTPNEV